MKLIDFINTGARTVTLKIEGYWYVVAHGQTCQLQARHQRLAKAYDLEEVVEDRGESKLLPN